MVDARARRREARQASEHLRALGVDIQIAGDDTDVVSGEPACPLSSALDLGFGGSRTSRAFVACRLASTVPPSRRTAIACLLLAPPELAEHRQSEPPRGPEPKPKRIQGEDMALDDRLADEDRVRLSLEARAKESWIYIGQPASDLSGHRYRPDHRPDRRLPEDVHPAPCREAPERPRRHLLQADSVRLSRCDQPHHFLHVPLASGWDSCCRGTGSRCG